MRRFYIIYKYPGHNIYKAPSHATKLDTSKTLIRHGESTNLLVSVFNDVTNANESNSSVRSRKNVTWAKDVMAGGIFLSPKSETF